MFPYISAGCVLTSKVIVCSESYRTNFSIFSWCSSSNQYLIAQRQFYEFFNVKHRTYRATCIHKDPFSPTPDKIWMIIDSDKERYELIEERNKKTHKKYKEREYAEESVLLRFHLQPKNLVSSPAWRTQLPTERILQFKQYTERDFVVFQPRTISFGRLLVNVYAMQESRHKKSNRCDG